MTNALQQHCLRLMNVPNWFIQDSHLQPSPKNISKTLEQVQACVSQCTSCPLSHSRTQTVFSRGNANAPLLIIGEAPGYYEDKQGIPFVGKAGQLLNQMMKTIQLNPETEIYVTNIIKCQPPNNRDPQKEEIEACRHHLEQQITLIQPKLILALGRFAGQWLTQSPHNTLSRMRNQAHRFQDIPVIVTYHPAYLLRNPIDKSKAYIDLIAVKQQLKLELTR